MMRPLAGKAIRFLCAMVILGGKNPFVVELTSSIALLFGREPSALIPTFGAKENVTVMKLRRESKNVFFMIFI